MEQEQNKTEHTIPYVRMLRNVIPVLPVLGIVIALALSSGLVMSFDEAIGHFEYGAGTFYLAVGGIAVAAVVSAVLGRAARTKFSLAAFPDSPPLSACASYFTAIMAAVTSAAFFYDIYVLRTGPAGTLELAAAALMPAITVSMILGTHEKTRQSVLRIIFALLAALAVNLNMFACYFDFTLPLNSPVRNMITIAQAGVMIFLLSEVRLALSPDTRSTSPFYVFTAAFAASAVLGLSFGLCVYGFVSPHAAQMDISIYRFACYFGVSLLALSRLLALNTAAGTYVAPPDPEEEDESPEEKSPHSSRRK